MLTKREQYLHPKWFDQQGGLMPRLAVSDQCYACGQEIGANEISVEAWRRGDPRGYDENIVLHPSCASILAKRLIRDVAQFATEYPQLAARDLVAGKQRDPWD